MLFSFENKYQKSFKNDTKITPKTIPKSLQKPLPKRYQNLCFWRAVWATGKSSFAYIYIYIYDFGAFRGGLNLVTEVTIPPGLPYCPTSRRGAKLLRETSFAYQQADRALSVIWGGTPPIVSGISWYDRKECRLETGTTISWIFLQDT